MKKALLMAICVFSVFALQAQKTDFPLIGAQVFIEPGQNHEDIDSYFAIMAENGLNVARIRMFESHMRKPDGGWDYSLYDQAFASADKYGIKVFATLFPYTDELNDVGGFKFPYDRNHLESIGIYVDNIVAHFKDAPALYTWVLQNEPGTGGRRAPSCPLARELRDAWNLEHPTPSREGYLKASFAEQEFLRYLNDWYLSWISDRVCALDPDHFRHANPHQILGNIGEYDFSRYSRYLTSLGASMHLSWHFSAFNPEQFPLGVSLMSDIVRSSALGNPFWITELQGGNVTASGDRLLCPTHNETEQWLWTGISAGAEGIIFWTLNQRKAVREAGEWGLLTYLRTPSDRLDAAAQVSRTILQHKDVFANAEPLVPDITLLYNLPSIWTQRDNSETIVDKKNPGRQSGAVLMSLSAAYEAIAAWGVTPSIQDMEYFNWSEPEGKTIVLADCITIPSDYYEKIENFVRNGGKLIVTGLTGFYDENMRCSFMDGFPLKDVFGAQVSEVKVVNEYFTLPKFNGTRLNGHLWRGEMAHDSAKPILRDGDKVYGTANDYGKGCVIWIPSLIELGGWHRDPSGTIAFYGSACRERIDASPLSLSKAKPNVIIRTMKSGERYVTMMINKNTGPVSLKLRTSLRHPRKIYGESKIFGKRIRLKADDTLVTIWEEK